MYLQSSRSRNRQNADRFQLFASLNFNLSGCTLNSLLRWESKKYLKRPLLNLNPVMTDQAIKADKLITDYMSKSTEEEEKGMHYDHCSICDMDIAQVSQLIRIGCQRPQECGIEIRDEIYCQLIKQITGNSNRRSCFRGYQLILSCLAGFPPSKALAPFLNSQLLIGCEGGAMLSRRSIRFAEDCLRALEMIQKFGTRQWGLTRHEIVAILSGNCRLTVKVWLTGEYAVDIDVDSWTTVNEIKLAACAIVGINDTSILTINAVSSSIDQLGRQADTDNLASSRHLIGAIFEQLYHHHLILATANCNEMKKCRLKSLFEPTRSIDFSVIADRAACTLDSHLQIEAATTTYGDFNASDICLFSEYIESTPGDRKSKPVSYVRTGLFEFKNVFASSLPPAIKVDLKLRLLLWVFPYRGGCEPSSCPPDLSDPLPYISNNERCRTEVASNCGEVDDASYDAHNTDSFEQLKSQRSYDDGKSAHWPSEEAARNILFAQLVDLVAEGTLICGDDIDNLQLAALLFAEQYQQERRPLLSGLPSIALMQETVITHLNGALPPQLISMAVSDRSVAVSLIKSKLHIILLNADSPVDSGFGFRSFPNLMGLDCLERTARARNRRKYRIRTHCPSDEGSGDIHASEIKEKYQSANWANDLIWLEFLSNVIVRLWLLHLDTLTARECRDKYILAVRQCRGYGVSHFSLTKVTISIITRENNEELQNSDGSVPKKSNDYGETGSVSMCEDNATSMQHRWVPVESSYVCKTSPNHNDGSPVSAVALQLSIDSDGISLLGHTATTEHPSSIDLRGNPSENKSAEIRRQTGESEEQCSRNDKITAQLLLRVSFDHIVSWGYNDVELIIKFKQRDGNHEDSYYSDDDDADENQYLQNCHRAIKPDRNDWREAKMGYQNSDSSNSVPEMVSSVSGATTASGCPVQAKYHRQRYLNKSDTIIDWREQDAMDENHTKKSELGSDIYIEREWAEQDLTSESKHSVSGRDISKSCSEMKDLSAQFLTSNLSNFDKVVLTAAATGGYIVDSRERPQETNNGSQSAETGGKKLNLDGANDRVGDQMKRIKTIDSYWSDGISLKVQYGMEIAELLEIYSRKCISRKNDVPR